MNMNITTEEPLIVTFALRSYLIFGSTCISLIFGAPIHVFIIYVLFKQLKNLRYYPRFLLFQSIVDMTIILSGAGQLMNKTGAYIFKIANGIVLQLAWMFVTLTSIYWRHMIMSHLQLESAKKNSAITVFLLTVTLLSTANLSYTYAHHFSTAGLLDSVSKISRMFDDVAYVAGTIAYVTYFSVSIFCYIYLKIYKKVHPLSPQTRLGYQRAMMSLLLKTHLHAIMCVTQILAITASRTFDKYANSHYLIQEVLISILVIVETTSPVTKGVITIWSIRGFYKKTKVTVPLQQNRFDFTTVI